MNKIQEYIKEESENYADYEAYADGLSKGFELMNEFAEWVRGNAVSGNDGCWDIWDDGGNGNCHSKTTTELIEQFLKQKDGK